jgi:UDP-N-acetyl-D-mannosaminuronic acid transferase (WecB/TagA/CpsF family)
MSTAEDSREAAARVRSAAGSGTEKILGISFFNGTAADVVERVATDRGLVVAPSGTCFERLLQDRHYRHAITTADFALADSGFMVLLWGFLRRRKVQRISGYAYLQELLRRSASDLRSFVWVLPHERAREKLIAWSATASVGLIPSENCYVAPVYGPRVVDERLLDLVRSVDAEHVVIAIGAGAQEKLGWYLRQNAGKPLAIHCIGGALGFVTGDQNAIPQWADRLYLGWFLRLLSQPRVFLPRLWKGRVLPWLILRYGSELPPMRG